MYSTIMTGAVHGITSYLLRVETNISSGLPSFHMVGFMPEKRGDLFPFRQDHCEPGPRGHPQARHRH